MQHIRKNLDVFIVLIVVIAVLIIHANNKSYA